MILGALAGTSTVFSAAVRAKMLFALEIEHCSWTWQVYSMLLCKPEALQKYSPLNWFTVTLLLRPEHPTGTDQVGELCGWHCTNH